MRVSPMRSTAPMRPPLLISSDASTSSGVSCHRTTVPAGGRQLRPAFASGGSVHQAPRAALQPGWRLPRLGIGLHTIALRGSEFIAVPTHHLGVGTRLRELAARGPASAAAGGICRPNDGWCCRQTGCRAFDSHGGPRRQTHAIARGYELAALRSRFYRRQTVPCWLESQPPSTLLRRDIAAPRQRVGCCHGR